MYLAGREFTELQFPERRHLAGPRHLRGDPARDLRLLRPAGRSVRAPRDHHVAFERPNTGKRMSHAGPRLPDPAEAAVLHPRRHRPLPAGAERAGLPGRAVPLRLRRRHQSEQPVPLGPLDRGRRRRGRRPGRRRVHDRRARARHAPRGVPRHRPAGAADRDARLHLRRHRRLLRHRPLVLSSGIRSSCGTAPRRCSRSACA